MYARYTEYLRDLMLNTETKKALDKALSTYPIYTPKSKHEYIPNFIPTREELNQKLLNHYKYREIGFETVGRFLDELEIAMCEIMPRYNQLMLSMDQDFNMIYNVDYVRTHDANKEDESSYSNTGKTNVDASTDGTASGENDGTNNTTQTASSTNAHKHIKSQTPQDELNITAKNIDSVDYADEVNWNKTEDDSESENRNTTHATSSATTHEKAETETNTTGSGTGNTKGTENIIETVKGNYGQVSAQSLIKTYRETILNIEQKLIHDRRITELFMGIY